eukprot:jgi/Galph1/5400/GphlegSOOS_G4058.1
MNAFISLASYQSYISCKTQFHCLCNTKTQGLFIKQIFRKYGRKPLPLLNKRSHLSSRNCLLKASFEERAKEDSTISNVSVSIPLKNKLISLKVASYFLLWYAFNIVYNISNKKVLNVWPFPWTTAWIQLVIGILYVVPLWLFKLRPSPQLPLQDVKKLLPVAAAHTLGHVATVVSLGSVAVSFTHVVKALEPFVNVVASAVILRSTFPLAVYLSLLPVVGGVMIASATEISFTWVGFLSAMLSNFAFTARNIFSKMTMDQPTTKNMNPANLFAILTILSTILLFPFALLIEGPRLSRVWLHTTGHLMTVPMLLGWLFISGLFFYLYNEVAFFALDSVHPVTHSVGNTMKRVVIIITSLIVFKNPVTRANVMGSIIAIGGVLLYSLTKYYYSEKKVK